MTLQGDNDQNLSNVPPPPSPPHHASLNTTGMDAGNIQLEQMLAKILRTTMSSSMVRASIGAECSHQDDLV